jgi:hypothetical protein
VYSVDAIAKILAGSQVDCLSSDDGLIDFWFHPAMPNICEPNRPATEFLLGNSQFTATTVPLLYGGVIICSRRRGPVDGSAPGGPTPTAALLVALPVAPAASVRACSATRPSAFVGTLVTSRRDERGSARFPHHRNRTLDVITNPTSLGSAQRPPVTSCSK